MIIAIESASGDLSVALAEPDGRQIGDDAWRSAQRQSAELLPRLMGLLARHARRLEETSAGGVGIGPGSFTGLRVGMSLAKGLALALERPIIGIGSLEAWLAAVPEAEVAVARAGAHEAYLVERRAAAPIVVDEAQLAELLASRPAVVPHDVAEAFAVRGARPPAGAATALARMAAERLALNPAGDDLRRLEPAYLRAPRGVIAVEA